MTPHREIFCDRQVIFKVPAFLAGESYDKSNQKFYLKIKKLSYNNCTKVRFLGVSLAGRKDRHLAKEPKRKTSQMCL